MKFLILAENSNGTWPYLHFRNLGVYELHRKITEKGYQSTIIDWFTHWSEQNLKKVISSWFIDEPNPVIAISTPFNANDVHKIKSVLDFAREQYPGLKIIHGGSRTFDNRLKNIDIFFLGRSMQVFDDWLDNKDISKYVVHQNPLVLRNENFDQDLDSPVLAYPNDSDFISSYDILGFEIGVGCKFNCTFCNYELRGSKITRLTDSYNLKNYMETVHSKYGVTNFFVADDTPNESDEKLNVLAEAISSLNFKPHITAYSRLDIITGKQSQLDLYKKIQFSSIFFGIESFNETASKYIRKKSGLGNVYQTLKQLREVSPDTFTVGGIIVGLNGDSKDSIWESTKFVIENKLLDSFQFYPLSITKSNSITGTGFYSDLDSNPEKFNYKIINLINNQRQSSSMQTLNWASNWTNHFDAEKLTLELLEYCQGKIHTINHTEYAGLKAIGITNFDPPFDTLKAQAYSISNRLKQDYIKKKIEYIDKLK